jgi:hypothetical protein
MDHRYGADLGSVRTELVEVFRAALRTVAPGLDIKYKLPKHEDESPRQAQA